VLRLRLILAQALLLLLSAVSCGGGGDKEVLLGATTSVQDPGLLDELVRVFEDVSDYDVKPIVGGSGQTLETARRGEFDVVITHSPADEDKFIADGEGLDNRIVMRNFFLIAGPVNDPAGVMEAGTMGEAFERIAAREQRFISRGDNSGTHQREMSIWVKIGIQPEGKSWYEESTTGQGQSLLVADDKSAYTLVDSSTFTAFRQRIKLQELLRDENDPNIYSVIRVSRDKHPNVNEAGAIAFTEFVVSQGGQCVIARFGVEEYGEPLFEPYFACPQSARAISR
jgi:tungstate transport system substrate-binding protein